MRRVDEKRCVMGKFSLHVEHFTREQIHGLEIHHLRKGKTHSNTEIDIQRSNQNIVLVKPNISVFQDVKTDIETKVTGRVTKSSIWISEMVMTLPQDIPYEEATAYFKDCLDFLVEMFGMDCIKLAVIHMDETTPHCHFMIEPRTKDHRLSRKAIFTRDFLRELHQTFPRYLCACGWQLECERGNSKGKYTKSVKELKEETRKLEKLNEALKQDSKALIEANYIKIKKLYQRYYTLNQQISR